jgi:hypothetical protein
MNAQVMPLYYPLTNRTLVEVTNDLNAVKKALADLPTVRDLNRCTSELNEGITQAALGKITADKLDLLHAELRAVNERERQRLPLQEKFNQLESERQALANQEALATKRALVGQFNELALVYKSQCQQVADTFRKLILIEHRYGQAMPGWNTGSQLDLNLPILKGAHDDYFTGHSILGQMSAGNANKGTALDPNLRATLEGVVK